MTKRKLLITILGIALLAVVGTAGTWAYFQDSVTSQGNQLSTGKVVIDVDGVRSISGTYVTSTQIDDFIPSSADANYFYHCIVTNKGTIPVDLYAKINNPVPYTGMVLNVGGQIMSDTNYKLIKSDMAVNDWVDGDVYFSYPDLATINQNSDMVKTYTFDVTYTMVPRGHTIH